MKTVSVRIREDQARKLNEIADPAMGRSINAFVKRAVDLWLEIEGPTYREIKELRERRARERQAVPTISS